MLKNKKSFEGLPKNSSLLNSEIGRMTWQLADLMTTANFIVKNFM